MGQLMRVLGAPEVSAASGGCSEPKRAGQRRRAMRAHNRARSQRDTPQPEESLEVHHKKTGQTSCLFCCTSPLRVGSTVRADGNPLQLAVDFQPKQCARICCFQHFRAVNSLQKGIGESMCICALRHFFLEKEVLDAIPNRAW